MSIAKMGKIELTRSEPQLSAKALDQLIDLWLADCADRLDNLDPDGGYVGTTRGYADKICYFREWWGEIGPQQGWQLRRSDLREFERWLRHRRSRSGEYLAYNTRRDCLRRLRQMFRWAVSENYIMHVLPMDWVPPAAGEPPARNLIQTSDLHRLLIAAVETPVPLRNVTIVAVLIGTGVRRAECAGLRREDVMLNADLSGAMVVRNPKKTRRGKIIRTVAFDVVTGRYLNRWLSTLESERGPLFPNTQTGEHLTPRALGRIVRQCYDSAGLTSDQPCHDLRRKFVTEWRRMHRGADLDELLQRQVGHADGTMTSQYSLQGVEDVLEVFTSPMMMLRDDDVPMSQPDKGSDMDLR